MCIFAFRVCEYGRGLKTSNDEAREHRGYIYIMK